MTATLATRPATTDVAATPDFQSRSGRTPNQSQQTVLETNDLTKTFGSTTVVDGLGFSMQAGEVLGFLGPNGAGKSTTVGMILGLIRPTRGTITIDGQSLADHPEIVSQKVGAIIENPAFYPYLTGWENLRALAMMAGPVDEARIAYLLKLVNMHTRADRQYRTFSLGMKQRLGLAATLLTNPAIVILDEPTNGLHPAGQREIREIIPRLADEVHSVFLASHLLHEVEQVSDRVAIIQKGKLLATGSVDELLRVESHIELVVAPEERIDAMRLLGSLPFVDAVESDHDLLRVFAPPESGSAVNRTLADMGIYASRITVKRPTLEELFLELTNTDGQPTD